MTTITLAAPSTSQFKDAGIVGRLVDSFKQFRAGVRDGQQIEARYRIYSRMSHAQLAEIGITTEDLYRAALIGRPV